jgi:hypothetical protein
MAEQQQRNTTKKVLPFSTQPTFVKIGVGLTIYNLFVFFEELVIDKHGFWQLLPFYKFGKFCIWDLGAVAAITWFLASGVARRLKREVPPPPNHSLSVKASVGLMFINSTVLLAGILDRYKVLNSSTGLILLVLLILTVLGIVLWSIRPAPGSSFLTQPSLLKLAVGLALYNSVLFLEYFVINPLGIDRFLPLYNAESLSIWDLAIPLLIGLLIWSKGFRNSESLQVFRIKSYEV